MRTFKMSIQRGLNFAPSMIVDAKDHLEAEKIARSKSGLGSFKSWSFCAIELTNKNKVK
jgi:hypothetical protein